MSATLQIILKQTENSSLTVCYNQEKKIEKFCCTSKDVEEEFIPGKVWANEQPIVDIKKFKVHLSESSVSHFEISQGNLLLVMKLNDEIPLKIKYKTNNDEHYLNLTISSQLKVQGLKKILAEKLSLKDIEIYNEQNFTLEATKTLVQNEVAANAVLNVLEKKDSLSVVNPNEGYLQFGFVKTEFVNFEGQVLVGFSKSKIVPSYRTVGPGLTLEGTCNTLECLAYGKKVCSIQGIGTFNINEMCVEACCPQCKQKSLTDVNNCFFWNCIYDIKGKHDKDFEIENQKAPRNKALTFDEATDQDPKGNVVRWRYLKITTRPYPNSCNII